MIKARASGSKVYLYFMKKGRQARHRIPRNSCYIYTWEIVVHMAADEDSLEWANFVLSFTTGCL